MRKAQRMSNIENRSKGIGNGPEGKPSGINRRRALTDLTNSFSRVSLTTPCDESSSTIDLEDDVFYNTQRENSVLVNNLFKPVKRKWSRTNSERQIIRCLVSNGYEDADLELDIFKYLKKKEKTLVSKMCFGDPDDCKSELAKYREHVLNSMCDLQMKLPPYEDETFFIAVSLYDRVVDRLWIHPEWRNVLLVGTICLNMAIKAVEQVHLSMRTVAKRCNFVKNLPFVRKTEMDILKSVDFDLFVPTPNDFTEFLLKLSLPKGRLMKIYKQMAIYICELSLYEDKLSDMDNLLRSSCAVYITRKILPTIEPTWNSSMEKLSGLSEYDLKPTVIIILELLLDEQFVQTKFIYTKYSSTNHSGISTYIIQSLAPSLRRLRDCLKNGVTTTVPAKRLSA